MQPLRPVHPVAEPPRTTRPLVEPRRRSEERITTDGERMHTDHIDDTLTRITAAHAGLTLACHAGVDAAPVGRRAAHPAVRAGRLVAAVVALVLVLISGLGWVGHRRLDAALGQVGAVDLPPDGVLDAGAQAGDRNVLLLSTDSGGSAGATTRANTVVVVHVDSGGGRPVAVTLPPELSITRPPCERWDAGAGAYLRQTVPAEPGTTVDAAYAVGGPRCASRTVQQVTGLAITGFAAVDLSAAPAMVEAVGGIEVCVERPVLDAVLGPVVPAAGTRPLDGARAGDLVRAADVRGEPADAGLVRRQQRVLAAVLGRALSPGALLHPGRVGRLLPGLGTAAVSDGTSVDDLLALSRTLARGDTAIRAAPTEAQTDGGTPVLREDEAGALFAAVRTDRPLPDPAPGAQTPAPDDATLDVLNATGRDGLGAEIAGTLGDLGFRTAEPTTASRPAQDTVIRFSPDRAGQAQLLAATVPVASTVPDPGTSGVLQLVLGRSFDGTVRAAAGPGPTPGGEVTAAPTTCG